MSVRPEPRYMGLRQILEELEGVFGGSLEDLLADAPRVRALTDELVSRGRLKNDAETVSVLVSALADLTLAYNELRQMYPGDDEILLPLKAAIVLTAGRIS